MNNVGVTLSCPEFIHNISPEVCDMFSAVFLRDLWTAANLIFFQTLGSHVNVNCMAVVMVSGWISFFVSEICVSVTNLMLKLFCRLGN